MMLARRVAVVDVATDAAQAFRSMLEVLNGRTRCRWQLVDSIEDANVVVTDGRRTPPPGPHHVIAIVDSVNVRPCTPYVLTHPFRVMQVLSILDEIAEDTQCAPETRAEAAAPQREAGAWDFAHSLRAIRARPPGAAGYRAYASGGGFVLVAADLRSYTCDAGVQAAIRAGDSLLGALTPAGSGYATPRSVRGTAFELFWHAAWNASTRLAPWLEPGAPLRIRRWPDFGAVPATRGQLQLVATLARRASTRNELVRLLPVASSEIDRTLNALSLAELLEQADVAAAPRAGAAAPANNGLLRSLIRGLRDRFGGTQR